MAKMWCFLPSNIIFIKLLSEKGTIKNKRDRRILDESSGQSWAKLKKWSDPAIEKNFHFGRALGPWL